MSSASIQKILKISVHPNADSLELIKVLGWQVVAKKGEFQEGDLVVYIETDTIVEDIPQYSFLKNKNFRIKPIRLRGEWSEGLILNLTEFASILLTSQIKEGLEVDDLVKAKHYEKPIPASLSGEVKYVNLPYGLSKTDETRGQAFPDLIQELWGVESVISTKMDGSSGSFIWKYGQFDVCSRNQTLKENIKNSFWQIAHKHDLQHTLTTFNQNIALRGEVCGPGIQKNLMGFSELTFCLFDIYDIDNRRYFNYTERMDFAEEFEIPIAPVLWLGKFNFTMKELEDMAENEVYLANQKPIEGIVVRPIIEMRSVAMNSRLSFKIISKKYGEKE
jgi:RNA ligase (TIGR02306 family)